MLSYSAQPFFHPLADNELREFIATNGASKKLSKGEIYKDPHKQLSQISIVESGLCYYQYLNEQAEEVIIAIASPGSIMGDASFLAPMNIPMHVRVRRTTHIKSLSFDFINERCQKDRHLFELLVASSIQKFRCYMEGMLVNFTQPPEKRLRFLLKSLLAENPKEWAPVTLKLTHEEYGEIINVSRVTVNRTLNLWKENGMLKIIDGILYVNRRLYEEAVL